MVPGGKKEADYPCMALTSAIQIWANSFKPGPMSKSNQINQEPDLKRLLLRSISVWMLLMGAEVIHGTLRTVFLAPRTGDFRARQISVFTGSALILGNTYLTIKWIGASRKRTLVGIGLAWLFLTLLFELGLGRWVLHYSWARLAADYNLRKGGLQPVGLLLLTLAPFLMARLRARQHNNWPLLVGKKKGVVAG